MGILKILLNIHCIVKMMEGDNLYIVFNFNF